MAEMSFRINREEFYKALQTVNTTIISNSPIPSLSGIKIEAKRDCLLLTGSDGDISIQLRLANKEGQEDFLQIEEPGTVVIDARWLMDIVKNMDSDEVRIEILDGALTHFSGNKAEFKINGFNAEDYPAIDFTAMETPFMVDCDEFATAINRTIFAVGPREARPILSGIHFQAAAGNLVLTATDSYRLARFTMPVKANDFSVTVPAKFLSEAKSIFTSGTVEISIGPRMILMHQDNIIIESSLLEGTYPETDRLIPSSFSCKLVINRNLLENALSRSSFLKTDTISVLRMQINSADDILVTSRSQEIGEYREDLHGVSYEGAPLDISFAGRYVLDAVRALTNDNITLQFTGPMKPFILQNDENDSNLLQLVLPVRTYN
jgi:DNA polymerase-3 subunit beta